MLCLGRYKPHKQGYAITSPLHQPDKIFCGIRQKIAGINRASIVVDTQII